MTEVAQKDQATGSTKGKNKDPKKEPKKDQKPEVVDIADYTSFFEYRKNMKGSHTASYDLKGTENFDQIVDQSMDVINSALRKAIIWTSYKNRRSSQLVNEIFVESKDFSIKEGDELLPDAWRFGVTGRPDGGMTEFKVVAPDDKACKYVCAVLKPRSTLGFYSFDVKAGLFPTSSKLDLKTVPKKCIVQLGYSRLEQIVVYFLPKELA
jgi:hypothetical protein